MTQDNPYATPVSDAPGRPPLDEDRLVTPQILEAMVQTRPWVLFLAVLGFVGAGLCLLVAVGTFAFGTFSRIPAGGAGFAAMLYIGIAAIYFFGSLHLWRYAASIKLMGEGYGVHALTDALRHQKSFWRLSGILAVVMIGFWLLAVAAMVAFR